MQITIAGAAVPVLHGTTSIQRTVGQRSTGSFQTRDDSGTARYYAGQPVVITDNNGNTAFAGVVSADNRTRVDKSQRLIHTVGVADNHYFAEKRLAPVTYTNQTAGYIANDLITQFLSAEGVTAIRGVNMLSADVSDVRYGVTISSTASSTDTFYHAGTGFALSLDSANAWHGAFGLKCVSLGTSQYEDMATNLPASAFTPGATYTLSFYAKGATGTESIRYFFEGNNDATGNHSIGSTPVVTLTTSWQRYTVTATMPNPIVDTYIGLRIDTGTDASSITFWLDGLQIEAAASASTWELGNNLQPSIQAGPTVVSLVSNYARCSDVLDALVQKAGGGWYWNIDDNKVLWFQDQTSAPAAPYTIDDTLTEWGTDKATHAGNQYRNKQYMLGGVSATAQQTEQRAGDGKATAFTMSYPLNSVPTITLNGGAQTVGIKGVDTGKNWYWSKGDPVIAQDSGGTKLVATDTLQVVYYGQFPAVAISSDNSAINTQQMREGGTGIVEAAAFDTTITSTDQAFQSAAGYLSKYAHDLDTFSCLTLTYGFAEGQLATVNVPAYDFNNEQMLIESVTITDRGPIGGEIVDLYYALKCVSGPINTGWQAWYKQLASQSAQVVGAITLGQSQTLALLQTVSESWNWTESVSQTVYACPVLPWTLPVTLC